MPIHLTAIFCKSKLQRKQNVTERCSFWSFYQQLHNHDIDKLSIISKLWTLRCQLSKQESYLFAKYMTCAQENKNDNWPYKKAQLSLTNPRDAKACQKLLQFDVLITLSLTILAYLHSFSCCWVRNLRNPAKFTENSNLWSSRSYKVIDLGVNRKPMYDFLLVNNSNFGRICYRFRDIDT